MNVADYLIDHSDVDWPVVLADWCPPLPGTFTVWLMNRFGDLFIVTSDQQVSRLSPDSRTLTHVALNRDAFCDLIDQGDNARDWLMIPLVDACVTAGIRIDRGQCYSLAIPAVLGGLYVTKNIKPVAIIEYFSLMASIHSQIEDLPDGTKIRLTVR